jgi:hypothetical protein
MRHLLLILRLHLAFKMQNLKATCYFPEQAEGMGSVSARQLNSASLSSKEASNPVTIPNHVLLLSLDQSEILTREI